MTQQCQNGEHGECTEHPTTPSGVVNKFLERVFSLIHDQPHPEINLPVGHVGVKFLAFQKPLSSFNEWEMILGIVGGPPAINRTQ